MLRQCSIDDITEGRISREKAYLVVCMHFYPRHLKKEMRDEYLHKLAPDEKLLKEFNSMKTNLADHNAAFRVVKYEEKFKLVPEALDDLKRLADLSQGKDVYLACLCGTGERCHRDLLLMVAEYKFKASVEKPRFAYPDFAKRLEKNF